MRNVDVLARAIAIAEGYQDTAGNVLDKGPKRRKNPGSLRASKFASGNVNGYSIFATELDGWRALYRQIGLDRDRKLTVEQFVYKFAPAFENRTAEYYLPLILRETGFKPTDRLDLLIEPYAPNFPTVPAGLPGVKDPPPVVAAGSWPAAGAEAPSLSSSLASWGIGPGEIAVALLVFAGAVLLWPRS